MADYHTFTTARATKPNATALLAAVRAAVDPSVGGTIENPLGKWQMKKNTVWTAPQITAAQTALDTCAADTPQLSAQQTIDAMPIFEKAIVLTILDQFNLVRSKLVPPLPPITVAQMIQAIRDKAGTL